MNPFFLIAAVAFIAGLARENGKKAEKPIDSDDSISHNPKGEQRPNTSDRAGNSDRGNSDAPRDRSGLGLDSQPTE